MELSDKELGILRTLALKGGQHLNDMPWMTLDRLQKARLITETWMSMSTDVSDGYYLTPQGAEMCRAHFDDLPADIKTVTPAKDSTNRGA